MKFFSYITEKRDEEYPALNGVRAISIVCGTVIQSLSYSRTFATFIVAVLFTFLFCTILFYLIERPFLKLKDKWIARLKAGSAATPN